ncbi:unnamed protein product, partial [marine sediment metagenome]
SKLLKLDNFELGVAVGRVKPEYVRSGFGWIFSTIKPDMKDPNSSFFHPR